MSTTVNLGRVVGNSGTINGVSDLTLSAAQNGGVTYTENGSAAIIKADTSVAQVKLTGEEGQIVGFDTNGDPVAVNDPTRDIFELYGFELNLDESEPSNMIRYIEDNTSYTPAGMNFTNGVFNYGDWGDASQPEYMMYYLLYIESY